MRKYGTTLKLRNIRKRLDVTGASILHIEKDERSITEQMILAICRKFNINEYWLRYGTGDMFIERTRNQIITDFAGDLIRESDSFKRRFFEGMAELDEKDWENIERIVMKLAKKLNAYHIFSCIGNKISFFPYGIDGTIIFYITYQINVLVYFQVIHILSFNRLNYFE